MKRYTCTFQSFEESSRTTKTSPKSGSRTRDCKHSILLLKDVNFPTSYMPLSNLNYRLCTCKILCRVALNKNLFLKGVDYLETSFQSSFPDWHCHHFS